jgi:hypothetical protein
MIHACFENWQCVSSGLTAAGKTDSLRSEPAVLIKIKSRARLDVMVES